jgi:ribose 5-phosphate isomerase B
MSTDKPMKFALGADHGGFAVKQSLAERLRRLGHEVVDYGTTDTNSTDYPDYGARVAQAVSNGAVDRGVLVCGTGIGMSIVANKFPQVRAALVTDPYMARMAAEHNDANLLVMGARNGTPEQALEMLETWLTTAFEGGRHQRRLDKIAELERRLTEPESQ